jgi:hypothetical protein
MRRGSLAVAMLVCGAGALSAQTVNVTLLEKTRTTTTYPSRSTEAMIGQSNGSGSSRPGDAEALVVPNHSRALPLPDTTSSGSAAQAAPRTYTVTGARLRLQLPDGRILEAVCTDKMADQLSSQPRQSCLTPAEGPLEANFKGANVKLTWRVEKKKRSEVYSVLALPLAATAPPLHR